MGFPSASTRCLLLNVCITASQTGHHTLRFILEKDWEKGLCYKWVLTGENHQVQICGGRSDLCHAKPLLTQCCFPQNTAAPGEHSDSGMKPWGGLVNWGQWCQQMLELGDHEYCHQHPRDVCRALILLVCTSIPPAVLVVFMLCSSLQPTLNLSIWNLWRWSVLTLFGLSVLFQRCSASSWMLDSSSITTGKSKIITPHAPVLALLSLPLTQ